MSTNAIVNFCYGNQKNIAASIYIHWDGYPDGEFGMLKDLVDFFNAVEDATDDTRFNDPQYLAAKYVVYKMGGSIDSLGVGVLSKEDTPEQYNYNVLCKNRQKPKIKVKQ